jgi:aspartate dehydrogenase
LWSWMSRVRVPLLAPPTLYGPGPNVTEHRTAGLVLAGGHARRMGGGDKPLLTMGGRTTLAPVIAALGVPHIAISANGDPARFDTFGLRVLFDGAFQGQGLLAGVLAGLEWAASLGMTALLTAPDDASFLPEGLAAWLAAAPCCLPYAGHRHHLIATWPAECADMLRETLSAPGSRRVADFAEHVGTRYAGYNVGAGDLFANINTPDDLARARTQALNAANRTAVGWAKGGNMSKTVAIAGLGAIGLPLARALDAGVTGLRLSSVACRDQVTGRAKLAGFQSVPRMVEIPELAEADIVVEAAPAAIFERIALPALEAGRIFVPASAGALLPRMHLARLARQTGARIVVPTGALLGLDAVRAAAEGPIDSITIETRKPPASLIGAPYLEKRRIDVMDLTEPLLVFEGNALDAAAGFPANVNVAAALALAGIGPIRTQVRIWADPSVIRNIHTIRVEAEAARFTMTIENVPSTENPKTGRLTALSLLACLRGLVSTLKVGS